MATNMADTDPSIHEALVGQTRELHAQAVDSVGLLVRAAGIQVDMADLERMRDGDLSAEAQASLEESARMVATILHSGLQSLAGFADAGVDVRSLFEDMDVSLTAPSALALGSGATDRQTDDIAVTARSNGHKPDQASGDQGKRSTNAEVLLRTDYTAERLYSGFLAREDIVNPAPENPREKFSVEVTEDTFIECDGKAVALKPNEVFYLNVLGLHRGTPIAQGVFIDYGFGQDTPSRPAQYQRLKQARDSLLRIFPGPKLIVTTGRAAATKYLLNPNLQFIDKRPQSSASVKKN